MADHHRGPQHRHRHPAEGEQLLDVPPRSQMRGQVVVDVAQAAEIDDLPEARRGGNVPERGRRLGVALLEIVGVERVDQVVGGIDAVQSRRAGCPESETSPNTGSPAPE